MAIEIPATAKIVAPVKSMGIRDGTSSKNIYSSKNHYFFFITIVTQIAITASAIATMAITVWG